MDSDVIDLSCFPAESGDTDAGMSAIEVGLFYAPWQYAHVFTCMCAFAFESACTQLPVSERIPLASLGSALFRNSVAFSCIINGLHNNANVFIKSSS